MEKDERKRRKRKLKQLLMLKEEEKESQVILELTEVLEDLEKKGKLVDIQICPKCKSPKIRRMDAMTGDMLGHMAITPARYECLDCGWRGRLVLKASNRPFSSREVALVAEAFGVTK